MSADAFVLPIKLKNRPLISLGLRPVVTVHRKGDLTIVSDGTLQLAVVTDGRAARYKRGIQSRIDGLMRWYSLGRNVPVRPGDFAINFGANIGELTLGLLGKGCSVMSIDPDPVALRCLHYNIGSRAEIVETGLWKEDTDLIFYQKPDTADTTAIDPVGEPITLPAKKLDTLMAGYDGPIRVLVGDAEGAEPEVLEGATETLKRTDYLSIAVGPERSGQSTDEMCRAIVQDRGFEILPSRREWLVARRRQIVR